MSFARKIDRASTKDKRMAERRTARKKIDIMRRRNLMLGEIARLKQELAASNAALKVHQHEEFVKAMADDAAAKASDLAAVAGDFATVVPDV